MYRCDKQIGKKLAKTRKEKRTIEKIEDAFVRKGIPYK